MEAAQNREAPRKPLGHDQEGHLSNITAAGAVDREFFTKTLFLTIQVEIEEVWRFPG